MPSKVGRVRMPANNRLPVSASLKTSEIWKKSVGYDPYASVEELNSKNETKNEEINEKAQHLFNIARVTGNISTTIPGACARCNHVGHLSYQCRNFINLDEYDIRNDMKENELKERKNLGLISSTDSDSSSDSESDDSDRDAKKHKEKRRKRKHKDHKHRKDKHKKHHKHKSRDDKKYDDKLIKKKKEKHKSHHYDEKKDKKSKYRESDKKHRRSKER
ncbi:conserved Plasmodium protein, unknown function [Plasmodium chabaudi adami]|uniref:Uncharacterized protein n=1 Tax=Plasmodium chabaudi adami TaxID=5826 RepID=A0A1D3RXM9_PLACE|nr:conserved Plasmodium protein, unknown function [Plasmodium chabaudi adami]